MTIHIDHLEIYCIIGLLDFEREAEQRMLIDLKIDYQYTEGSYINYATIVDTIIKHLKANRYELLENALQETKKLLLQMFPAIEKIYIKMSKPDILSNCSVGLSKEWINTPQW